MTAEWFYHKDGQQFGPFTAVELRALASNGTLGPDDLVWKAGMTEWLPAGKVKGLFPTPPVPEPPPVPTERTPRDRRRRVRENRNNPAPDAPDNPFDFGPDRRGDEQPASDPERVAEDEDKADFKNLKQESIDRLYEKFALWRFGVVYLAVVVSSLLFLGLLALVGSKKDPPPWDGLLAVELVFAVFAGVAVCLLPLAAGHVWQDRSDYFGQWGSRELRIYIPASPLGWVGYYMAIWVSAGCCVCLLVLAFLALAVSSTRICPYCRSSVPSWVPSCTQCNMKLP
jgi:hypothetical protein